jgi:hypothetical protein
MANRTAADHLADELRDLQETLITLRNDVDELRTDFARMEIMLTKPLEIRAEPMEPTKAEVVRHLQDKGK